MTTLIMIVTIPGICQYLPDSDWIACNPPPVDQMCFSITNYWPFNENNELVPYGGQADSHPNITANGYEITGPEDAFAFVAAPLPFIGKTFCVSWLGCVPINDTFGNPVYQSGPFWHNGYQQHVIPIDVFTSDPIYRLECNAEIK